MPRRKADLRWVASRMSSDPWFLGSALEDYKILHRLDSRQMAWMLECKPDALIRLALCRRPDSESEGFPGAVIQIAKHVSCNASRLMKVLLEAETMGEKIDEHTRPAHPSSSSGAPALVIPMACRGGTK